LTSTLSYKVYHHWRYTILAVRPLMH